MSTFAMTRALSAVRVFSLLMAALLATPLSYAAVFSADAVKAAFLYRFASYVEWPEDVPAEGPFLIGVYGADEVAKQLDELLPKMTVHGRPAAVRRITRLSDIEGVSILYFGPQQPLARSRTIREAAIEKPILIVTDDERGLDAGGVINFLDSTSTVRFEVSLAAADRARLKVAAALLSVAARVERRPQAWAPCGEPYLRPARHSACAISVANINERPMQ